MWNDNIGEPPLPEDTMVEVEFANGATITGEVGDWRRWLKLGVPHDIARYRLVRSTGMNFGEALAVLRAGGRVARVGWNGRDMWLEIQFPDEHSKMTLPYIFIRTACGNLVPWLASQTDILSSDWKGA
jgi:hypothetical protein